jgi:CubicO group peptidase (beta-lactamase class C family)
MRNVAATLAACLLLLVTSGPPTIAEDRRLEAKVDAYLAPHLTNRDLSGTVLIARGDTIRLGKAYGMANYELNVANTLDTKFRIASVTKTFTAAAIIMLRERGALGLDDPLLRYIPDYPKGEKITVEQLLRHRAGIPVPEDLEMRREHVSIEDVIGRLKREPLDFEPGTDDRYSGSGYKLLAYIVQRASGRSYGDFLRGSVFQPLGMADSGEDRDEPILPNRASGYLPGPGRIGLKNAYWIDLSSSIGSGSLYSTAKDLHRWARAVCSERLFRWKALPYPFGWGRRSYFGHPLIEQSGVEEGFCSYLAVSPEDGLIVVCLSNVQAGAFQRFGKDLVALALGKECETAAVHRMVAPPGFSPDLYAGRYASPEADSFLRGIRLIAEGGQLYYRWDKIPSRRWLMPISDTEFLDRTEGAKIRVERDGDGPAKRLTMTWGAGGPGIVYRRLDSAR